MDLTHSEKRKIIGNLLKDDGLSSDDHKRVLRSSDEEFIKLIGDILKSYDARNHKITDPSVKARMDSYLNRIIPIADAEDALRTSSVELKDLVTTNGVIRDLLNGRITRDDPRFIEVLKIDPDLKTASDAVLRKINLVYDEEIQSINTKLKKQADEVNRLYGKSDKPDEDANLPVYFDRFQNADSFLGKLVGGALDIASLPGEALYQLIEAGFQKFGALPSEEERRLVRKGISPTGLSEDVLKNEGSFKVFHDVLADPLNVILPLGGPAAAKGIRTLAEGGKILGKLGSAGNGLSKAAKFARGPGESFGSTRKLLTRGVGEGLATAAVRGIDSDSQNDNLLLEGAIAATPSVLGAGLRKIRTNKLLREAASIPDVMGKTDESERVISALKSRKDGDFVADDAYEYVNRLRKMSPDARRIEEGRLLEDLSEAKTIRPSDFYQQVDLKETARDIQHVLDERLGKIRDHFFPEVRSVSNPSQVLTPEGVKDGSIRTIIPRRETDVFSEKTPLIGPKAIYPLQKGADRVVSQLSRLPGTEDAQKTMDEILDKLRAKDISFNEFSDLSKDKPLLTLQTLNNFADERGDIGYVARAFRDDMVDGLRQHMRPEAIKAMDDAKITPEAKLQLMKSNPSAAPEGREKYSIYDHIQSVRNVKTVSKLSGPVMDLGEMVLGRTGSGFGNGVGTLVRSLGASTAQELGVQKDHLDPQIVAWARSLSPRRVDAFDTYQRSVYDKARSGISLSSEEFKILNTMY